MGINKEEGMVKEIFGIIIGGIIVLMVLGFALRQYGGKENIFVPPTPQRNSSPSAAVTGTQSDTPTPTAEVKNTDGKSVVEKFLKAISDHKPTDAVMLMSTSAVGDDSQKQAWAVQLGAFKSLLVKSIEPSMPEEWTDNRQTYKVTMDVTMTPDSANMPIPYFGYDKGTNVRWISALNDVGGWKVTGIATGP